MRLTLFDTTGNTFVWSDDFLWKRFSLKHEHDVWTLWKGTFGYKTHSIPFIRISHALNNGCCIPPMPRMKRTLREMEKHHPDTGFAFDFLKSLEE